MELNFHWVFEMQSLNLLMKELFQYADLGWEINKYT